MHMSIGIEGPYALYADSGLSSRQRWRQEVVGDRSDALGHGMASREDPWAAPGCFYGGYTLERGH
jgi:hypothetical protein